MSAYIKETFPDIYPIAKEKFNHWAKLFLLTSVAIIKNLNDDEDVIKTYIEDCYFNFFIEGYITGEGDADADR